MATPVAKFAVQQLASIAVKETQNSFRVPSASCLVGPNAIVRRRWRPHVQLIAGHRAGTYAVSISQDIHPLPALEAASTSASSLALVAPIFALALIHCPHALIVLASARSPSQLICAA